MKPASNNQIKLLRKLKQRKYRAQEGLFVVEGERAVEQVLENGLVEVEAVFLEKGKSEKENAENSFELDSSTFREIANTDSPQGVFAVCRIPDESSIDSFSEDGIIVATDAIQDPGNLGTIIRTAVWYRVKGILLGEGTVDLFNPKVVRSTAGATCALPYKSGSLNELLSSLEKLGWQTILLDGNPGSEPIQNLPSHRKMIIVVGNEANGINNELIQPNRPRVLLPSNGAQKYVESLNAGVSIAISLAYVNN